MATSVLSDTPPCLGVYLFDDKITPAKGVIERRGAKVGYSPTLLS